MAETSTSLLSLSYVLGANSTPVPAGPLIVQGTATLGTGDLDSRFAALLAQSEGDLLQQLQSGLASQTLTAEQLQGLLASRLQETGNDSADNALLLLGDAPGLLAKLLGGKDLPGEQQDLPAELASEDSLLGENGEILLLDASLLNSENPPGLQGEVGSAGEPTGVDDEILLLFNQLKRDLNGEAGFARDPALSPATGLQATLSGEQGRTARLQAEPGITLDDSAKTKVISAEQLVSSQLKANAAATGAEPAVAGHAMLKNQQEFGPDHKLPGKLESLLQGLHSLDGSKLSLEPGTLEAFATRAVDAADPKSLDTNMLHLSTVPMNFRSPVGSTVAAAQVQTSVFSPDWGGQIAEKLVWFSVNNIRSAELQLDPPELGPLQVRINIQNDQTSIHFTSQHSSVREALDQSLPRLREIFVDNGLNLADVDVSDQSSKQSQQTLEQQTAAASGDIEDEHFEQQLADSNEEVAPISYSLNIVDAYA